MADKAAEHEWEYNLLGWTPAPRTQWEYYYDGKVVLAIGQGAYSMHSLGEEADGVVGYPFEILGPAELGYSKVEYSDLPTWAQDQIGEGRSE